MAFPHPRATARRRCVAAALLAASCLPLAAGHALAFRGAELPAPRAAAVVPPDEAASRSFDVAQASGADLAIRLQQVEGQMRALNGRIEQLEFQNRRLQDSLQRFQGDVDFRFQDMQGSKGGARPPKRTEAPPPASASSVAEAEDVTGTAGPGSSGPGAAPGPANLGRIGGPEPGGFNSAAADPGLPASNPGGPMVLAPPRSGPAAPTAAPEASGAGGSLSAGSMVASAPTSAPRDEFDLGVGFIQRKDYELAEITLRRFLQEHPDDRLVSDAQYWLGESLYQRGQYRPAAEYFLKVTTGAPATAKAPDSLLRLGMSLSGLNEREAACATYAEVARKYPRASASVRAQVDRELKRVKC